MKKILCYFIFVFSIFFKISSNENTKNLIFTKNDLENNLIPVFSSEIFSSENQEKNLETYFVDFENQSENLETSIENSQIKSENQQIKAENLENPFENQQITLENSENQIENETLQNYTILHKLEKL